MGLEHRTFCRLCGASCGAVVVTDGPRVLEIRGDKANPLTEGYLCGKGRTLGAAHLDPRRINHPLVGRVPMRVEVDPRQALDDLATNIRQILDESGPDAVAVYMGTNAFLESGSAGSVLRLASALGPRSYYSAVTVDNIAFVVAGLKLTGGTTSFMPTVDFSRTRFLLMFGHNPVVSHTSWPNPVVKLRRIRARGEVWVVDPRKTETAKLASRHLQVRAGSDLFLAAFLVRELLRYGADEQYLSSHTFGLEQLREAVEPHTLEFTAARVGLVPSDLIDLVQAIRRVGLISVTSGTGIRMGRYPAATMWLIFLLSIITRSWDLPGAGMVSRFRVGPRGALPRAPGPRSRPELAMWSGEMPCAAMADEIEAGNLRALISIGGNPVTALPDPVRLSAALKSLEVFAVYDMVPTASTDLASHVLPGTSQLEDACMAVGVTPTERKRFAQYAPVVFPPSYDRRPSWWWINELGKRLGLSLYEGASTDEEIKDAVYGVGGWLPSSVEHEPTGMVIGEEAQFRSFVDTMPGCRWTVAPPELIEQLEQARSESVDVPELVLIPRRQSRHVNSFLTDIAAPSGKADKPDLLMNPVDANRLGVTDGDLVVVSSSSGELRAPVHVTDKISRGSVSVPHGYRDVNVGVLTSSYDSVDPITGMPLQAGIPVSVRRDSSQSGKSALDSRNDY